jgi:hypothetical protein
MTTIPKRQNNTNFFTSILKNRNNAILGDYYNSSSKKTLQYCLGHFYSYNTIIASFVYDGESPYSSNSGEFWYIEIVGLLGKYGNFKSMTTSRHIGMLIRIVKDLNIDFKIVDENGNIANNVSKKEQYNYYTEKSCMVGKVYCSICLDEKSKKKFVKTKCGHHFHKRCIDMWVKKQLEEHSKASCPLCKTKLV